MSANVIDVLQRTVELLSKLSNLLNVALSPKITEGVLQKIDVSKLSQDTLLVIIAVKSGMVKTITLQINLPLEDYEIEEACKLLNQRLSGLPLSQVRQQIAQRVKEIPPSKQKDFITLFVDNADQLFRFEDESEFYLSGFKTLINQPEFHQPENLRIMTELIVDRKELTQLISGTTPQEGTKVNIGEENITEHSRGLSVLSSVFRLGDNVCAIGVIGPTRMNYAKIFSVVNYFTKTIDKHFNK
jgi:heat-inducible transcriptional repressor